MKVGTTHMRIMNDLLAEKIKKILVGNKISVTGFPRDHHTIAFYRSGKVSGLEDENSRKLDEGGLPLYYGGENPEKIVEAFYQQFSLEGEEECILAFVNLLAFFSEQTGCTHIIWRRSIISEPRAERMHFLCRFALLSGDKQIWIENSLPKHLKENGND